MHIRNIFCCLSAVLIAVCFADDEMVDPCFPDQAGSARQPAGRGWLPARIRRLKAERDQLLQDISVLPQHNPRPFSDHIGYHSVPVDARVLESGATASQIDVRFESVSMLDSIALMPAFVTEASALEPYAFPKRFKIDVLESRGRWVGDDSGQWVDNREQAEWVEVVNWLDEDFPDPGPYPVFFAGAGRSIYQVRLSVPQAEAAVGDFYALGEIFLFRRFKDGQTGDNMMRWGDVQVQASNALSKPPLWDTQYLRDGLAGLGLPLSEETADVDDLMVAWESEEPNGPVQIVMDLGAVRDVGGLQLWPAAAPSGMAVPLFGFPGKVVAEFSVFPDFRECRRVEVDHARRRMHRDNLLIITTGIHEARYLRVTFDDLEEYQGSRILGLGEIRVAEHGKVWSTGCKVSAVGLPANAQGQLPRLVDGFCRHRSILSEAERIRGLAKRRPLDRRLAEVKTELAVAENAWRALEFRFSVAGGLALLLALVAGWRGQRRQRKRELNRLRQRITRDLHDEVGSNIGGISLMSEELETLAKNPEIKEELGELTLMAREACSSLREVVWVTDQRVLMLPELVEKLAERAERTLRGMELSMEISPDFPQEEVGLNFKRHLIMFFKEAVHNCARHSGAAAVNISLLVSGDVFTVSVQDNGCGFDPSKPYDGWGLGSMKKRAEELGGAMKVESCPGGGTTVSLNISLSTLTREPVKAYKTSN